jgi:hypothetical protein
MLENKHATYFYYHGLSLQHLCLHYLVWPFRVSNIDCWATQCGIVVDALGAGNLIRSLRFFPPNGNIPMTKPLDI